ncbi:MAG: aminomethyl-transferring glycine dehydrogenase [Nitriliruptorales bacterium]|nr:aminomethyl-transferring glycine dehydrogenase [Nitriliruptorales bacterium]
MPSIPASDPRLDFIGRHIGPSDAEVDAMLEAVGYADVAALVDAAVPGVIRNGEDLHLGRPHSEPETLELLRGLADRNVVLKSLIGMGYTGTVLPPVIQRNVLEDPGWYTAYTPYQPEISQGRLEALLTFQTMVMDLTGMELANASLLDEATAAAEAMAMLHRVSRGDRERFVVDPDCHPQTIEVVRTRAQPLGLEVVVADPASADLDGAYGVLVQYPGSSGEVRDLGPIVERCHASGALVAVSADILALVLLRSPGEVGADVVVGSTQRFGVPLMFGGPHAAYLACREDHKRALPGRLVGVSVDGAGRTAYRLALQTREQHIRRERATSNICTSQVLLAVIAAMYAVYHGPQGLAGIAERVHRQTVHLRDTLAAGGVDATNEVFFDTLTLAVEGRADDVLAAARDLGFNLRRVDADHVGVTLDETVTDDDLELLVRAFGVEGGAGVEAGDGDVLDGFRRDDEILTHEVFHAHRSETQMLRYLRRLKDKDVALDRSMIPLGSCTMKLNAAAEMIPITWPGFTDLHPFAPLDQAAGYLELIGDLEAMLADITGYDRVSVQPNAGSQGEFAGLLAISSYHRDRGEEQRRLCLIPESAHGTNAASAVMAGMEVKVVDCDEDGNVDVDHLKKLVTEHEDQLAALMVTYPSTHGVYETAIREVCELVHQHGGQVYLDGANLNALVGVAAPGEFGADVSHLNLHKTFCIPHGGGGPGVGPVAVREHLAPFLPNHPVVAEAGPETGPGPISAAPWGSAGILPISWAYITLMGSEGLARATELAILNANYLATELAAHYPVLYTGEAGLVAHECIIDLRDLQRDTGISNEDVAKRLTDYGFHAPTMSFPVAGTLMIEPTESESKDELDRFVAAMVAIRDEIERVASGEWPADDNPLVNAPHPAEDLLGEWDHPYSREEAAYPVESLRADKYWPPVSRVDQAYGDRNLVCACPPMDEYR